MCEKVKLLAMFDSLQSHGLEPTKHHCPWNSPGKKTGVGSLPSPGDLPNVGIKSGSPALHLHCRKNNLHCRQILLCLSHQISPQNMYRDTSTSRTQKVKFTISGILSNLTQYTKKQKYMIHD